MEHNLVAEGLKFMVLGMGTVFVFLMLMVLILHFQSKIINRYFPQKESVPLDTSSVSNTTSKKDNNALVAAITAAIITHKNS
ncbi:OadG family protein [Sulfurospirillum sp. 1307]|jgi:oxaloacetate decarboxylase gamma subunit